MHKRLGEDPVQFWSAGAGLPHLLVKAIAGKKGERAKGEG